MPEYDNSNRVALWFNEKRDKKTSPLLSGQGETTIPVWASAWVSDEMEVEDKKTLFAIFQRYEGRKPIISVSLQAKENKPARQSSPAPDDSDVPF